MTAYTMAVTCESPFDETLSAVRAELAAAGFGVLTEIDLSATVRQKIGAEVPAEVILGACNPHFAYRAITAAPSVATLLPCNVVVRSVGDDATLVEAFDPGAMVTLVGEEDHALASIAAEVRQQLKMTLARVSAPAGQTEE